MVWTMRAAAGWLLLAMIGPFVAGAAAADEDADPATKVTWLIGPAAEKRLQSETSAQIEDVPLRRCAQRLAQAHGVAFLMDRRVDPSAEVSLKANSVALRDVWTGLAAKQRSAASFLGPVVYLGPEATARRLRTVAALRKEDVQTLPIKARGALVRSRAWHWDELSQPRQLLQQLLDEAKVSLIGQNPLPHDLWGEADLPTLPWHERLQLLLIQFDLTFELRDNGSRIALTALPEAPTVERTFNGGAKAAALADQIRESLPDCEVRVSGGKVIVAGLLEDLDQIAQQTQGSRTSTKVTGPKELRFSLTVQQQPLASVLKQIADQAELDLEIDADSLKQAGVTQNQRVSATVKNATLDELFEALLKPVGLSHQRQGKKLTVRAAERD